MNSKTKLKSEPQVRSSDVFAARAAMQRAMDELRALQGKRFRADVASYAMTAINALDRAIYHADQCIEKEQAANDPDQR